MLYSGILPLSSDFFFIILISSHHLKDYMENQYDLPALSLLDSANYFLCIIFNIIYVSGVVKSPLEKK